MQGFLAPTGRRNRVARRILLTVAIVAVLGNLALSLVYNRLSGEPLLSAAAGQSPALVLVEPVDDDRVLTATRTDELILVAGGEPVARTQFESLIGAIAAVPDGNGGHQFAVGTADGSIVVLDSELEPVREFQVEGVVVGLTSTSAGDLVVAYGFGAFSDQYFVSYFPGDTVEPAYSTQVDFTVSGLIMLGETAIFGTLDSRVGAIPIDTGEVAWTATLDSPITRLLAIGEPERIIAGSENGDLTLLGAEGETRWTTTATTHPVRGIGFDAETETYVAGDARGNIIALDNTGQILLSQEVAEIDIEAVFATEPGDLIVVPREGAWQTLNPGAIGAVQVLGQFRIAWWVFNAVLLITAAVTGTIAVERWRVAAGRNLRAIWRSRLAYLFVLPGIALIALFSYYPAGLAFFYSLTDFSVRTINVTEFVGLANYREVLFDDPYFRTGLVNMVIIVVTSVIKTITVPLLVAQLIFWLRNSAHQYIFRTLFVLPAVVPDLVFTLMWRQVYDPNTGLMNQLLAVMGLARFQRAWLGDEDTAIWAIVFVGFPFVGAFAFLIFLGGLLSINPEYFDAAKVDGARWWQRLMHIDVPLLMPQFRILFFFAVVGSVQGLASVFILTGGGPGTATYVPALQMYLRISAGDFGYASAVGVVLFVLILILTLVILRYRRNEAVESS